MEIWKDVMNWEALYQVSDAGRVRSKDRIIHVKNSHGNVSPRLYRGRVLNHDSAIAKNYPCVSFTAPGRKRQVCAVHILVAKHFIGECPQGMDVCHFDNNRHNPRLDNLRYGTRSENSLDRHRHGTMPKWKGEEVPSSKLTEDNIRELKRNFRKLSARAWGRKFGVHHNTIMSAIRGETWGHVT